MSQRAASSDSVRALILLGLLWLLLAAAVIMTQLARVPDIEISWVTKTEYQTAGFNLYRGTSPDGEFAQINDRLIPSQGNPATGASYTYHDRAIETGRTYYYRLEEVEYDNRRRLYDLPSLHAPLLPVWAPPMAVVGVGPTTSGGAGSDALQFQSGV